LRNKSKEKETELSYNVYCYQNVEHFKR
jgi:hypothetical protein